MARPVARVLLRLGALGAGLGALAHAVFVFVIVPGSSTLERAAARIVMGESYRVEDLDRLASGMQAQVDGPLVHAAGLRAVAIVTLRQAETAVNDGRPADIDTHLAALGGLLPQALASAPSEPFLWLASFWHSNLVLGFNYSRVPCLGMSYEVGPNEGWIGVRRNSLALANFMQFPLSLQSSIAAEFVGLVASGFTEMPGILMGPGWGVRDEILPLLATVPEYRRKAFARVLYQAGADVVVPGVEQPDARPWSR